MRSADTTATRPRFRLPGLPGWLVNGVAVIVGGVLLGQQYVHPNKRVLPVIVGVIVSGLAWRVGMVAGLGVLVLALPFPRGTVFGNTNLALILILLVIWLLRISQRQSPAPSFFRAAVYGLNHPASVFIEGWIDFTSTVGTEFNTRNVRVGSMFHDYELLSEYCAITLLLVGFLLIRAKTVGRKTVYSALL